MILVCGATGMFGGRVLRELLDRGAPVRGLTHSPAKADALRALGAEVAIGDLDHPASLMDALDGVERVFLVSPMDHAIERRETALIAAAKLANVSQVVKLFGAVRHRGDPLVSMHLCAIDALKESGLAWALVSPNTVMESNLLPYGPTIKELGQFFGAAAEGRIGMVALQDCARAAATVLTGDIDAHNRHNYEITGPEALTMAQIAERFTRVLGKPVTYQDMPEEAFADMLVNEAGFNRDTLEIDVLCHARAFRRGDADLVTDTFTKLTGAPSTTVDEFIEAHRAAFE